MASDSIGRLHLLRICISLFVGLASTVLPGTDAQAEEPVPVLTETETLLRFHVRAVFEQGKPLDAATVAAMKDAAVQHPTSPPNFGRYSQPVWGYVAVINRLPRREWALSYTLATVEDVQIFVREAGEQDFRRLHELGEDAFWPFSGYRSATFLLTLRENVSTEIITRLHTRAPIGFPLSLSSPTEFFATDRKQIASAATLGAVPLVVTVYVAILSSILRNRGLISLIFVLLTKLILDSWVSGFGLLMFPFISRSVWPTFGFFMVGAFHLSCVLHFRHYLHLPKYAPRLDALLLAAVTLVMGLAAVEMAGLYNVRSLLQFIPPFVFAGFVAISAAAAWRRPSLGAFCYTLAWGFFLSEASILMLRLLALVPFSVPTWTFSQSAVASLLFGVAIFRRIKDQDEALNQSLMESNERFQLATDGSAAAIYEYTPGKIPDFFAPRLTELLSLPERTSLPRFLGRLSRPMREQILDALREASASRLRHFRVEIGIDRIGSLRFFAISGAIQYSISGAITRICGSIIDITSDRALAVEQQLLSALSVEKDRAERSLSARTIFFAAANHDLRHPLLSLGLYLQLLAKDTTIRRLKSYLPRMLEAHQSAFRYLDRIVDLARIDTGLNKSLLTLQPLQPIFQRLANQYQADATHRDISLRFVTTSKMVVTDDFLLDRVLSNLLSNAIRNTRSGGVVLGCRRLSDGIRIDVIDTGPGLPQEIFERFRSGRLHASTVSKTTELQLGLFVVLRTAEELGCSVDVATRRGKGTRFSVIIK